MSQVSSAATYIYKNIQNKGKLYKIDTIIYLIMCSNISYIFINLNNYLYILNLVLKNLCHIFIDSRDTESPISFFT